MKWLSYLALFIVGYYCGLKMREEWLNVLEEENNQLKEELDQIQKEHVE